jgi:hypothetical protein
MKMLSSGGHLRLVALNEIGFTAGLEVMVVI